MIKTNEQESSMDSHCYVAESSFQNRDSHNSSSPVSTVSETITQFPHLANHNNYVVVLSSGAEDEGKRATLAFSTACTAQAMELNTQLFLVGDGTYWAYQGSYDEVKLKGFPALDSLVESFVEMDGKIFVCSAYDTVCSMPEDNKGRPLVRQPFIKPRGLASILEYMVGGSSITC